MSNTNQTFGSFALPANREALRRKADRYGNSRIGKWMISLSRKRALKDLNEPFDVTVMPGVNARLWPRSNRCEKRAIAGIQIWDADERAALIGALAGSSKHPFVFLDVGANVGLYSLILAAEGKQRGIETKIFAVEPDTQNRQRLAFNIEASGADIQILPIAISDQKGVGAMGGGAENRGEVTLSQKDAGSQEGSESQEEAVAVETLLSLCTAHDLTYVNAMKLDIEGYDLRALTAFFNDAPKALWPDVLVLETGRDADAPLLELCAAQGYTLTQRAGINSILHLNPVTPAAK